MRYVLGLILAGGLVLGQAADAKAQVTFSFGNGGRPAVVVGQPYGGGYGYNQGYAPAPAYGYGTSIYQPRYQPNYQPGYAQSYVAPNAGSTYYSSGYTGYSPNQAYYNRGNYGSTYGSQGYSNYSGYPGYAPYGYSSGVNIAPAYGQGTYIPTPIGGVRIR